MLPRGGHSSAATDPSCGNWDQFGTSALHLACAPALLSLVGYLHVRWLVGHRCCSSAIRPRRSHSAQTLCLRNDRSFRHKTAKAKHLLVGHLRPAESCSSRLCVLLSLPVQRYSIRACQAGANTSRTKRASRGTKIILTASPCAFLSLRARAAPGK